MHRVAFKMKLFEGYGAEYKKRHAQIWPELLALLKETGIHDYSIFLNEETNDLFGVLKVADKTLMDNLSTGALMQKWWAYMSDIMESHPDNSPVITSFEEVFYLP